MAEIQARREAARERTRTYVTERRQRIAKVYASFLSGRDTSKTRSRKGVYKDVRDRAATTYCEVYMSLN